MALTDTKRGLAGLAWFGCNALMVLSVVASILAYFNGQTLDAIYLLLLAVPISRLANVFLLKNDPEGDAEYAKFILDNQASKK